MAIGPRHREQRSKNFVLLLLLVLFIGALYGITVLKFGSAVG